MTRWRQTACLAIFSPVQGKLEISADVGSAKLEVDLARPGLSRSYGLRVVFTEDVLHSQSGPPP
jgi:hypothetical protein